MNVGFVSLGCSKNLVDTEMMIGLFKNENFNIVSNPEEADIIVVNTCGFIEKAKEEAINTLLEMAEYKKKRCKFLVATGCLVERYKEELEKEMPEVDLFIKFSEYETFWEKIIKGLNLKIDVSKNKENVKNITTKDNENKIDENNKYSNLSTKTEKAIDNEFKLQYNNRVISTGKNYAYLRIADGCDNFCTFCAIPYIRGRFKSRTEEEIIVEAKKLANKGIKELIVIAQDTTKYGIDIYGKPKLADLLHKLSKIEGIEWIRFLYSYPETITDDLIYEVKNNDKICKYFDIPIQHISDEILKKMNRKTTKSSIISLITKLRNEIPNVIIRSTLMVGFPGETDENFSELVEFVEWAKFDKLGCFIYSKEDGTVASKMPNQIKLSIKKSRYNKIMSIQQQISKENLHKKIGKTYKTLIEDVVLQENGNVKFDNDVNNKNSEQISNKFRCDMILIGRTYMDIPEIDGKVYIPVKDKKIEDVKVNTFVKCKIKDVNEYDLIGTI